MDARIRKLNQAEVKPDGRYVLYDCRHNRRVAGNHALLVAASLANRLQVPLLVCESLSCDYLLTPADRLLHQFLAGVASPIPRQICVNWGRVTFSN